MEEFKPNSGQITPDLKNKIESTPASFAVSIDQVRIKQLLAESGDDEQRRAIFEVFSRLPEKLNFAPGITLIVGENGSGKSTLAKALFLRFKIVQNIEGIRKIESELKRFIKGRDEHDNIQTDVSKTVEEEVLKPSIWIQQAGLAPEITRTMTAENASSANLVEYADFPEIVGVLRGRDDRNFFQASSSARDVIEGLRSQGREDEYTPSMGVEYVRGNEERVLSDAKEKGRAMGSTRQTVDRKAQDIIFGDCPKDGPSTFFLDEPEVGLSPMRHTHVEKIIFDLIEANKHPDSILIIPTNSVRLFESDLPRIDLRHPEWGIFRPSEHSDYFSEE